jgi:L-alanine-DL-glutamate epimerase-like enolase superfamily enzyme
MKTPCPIQKAAVWRVSVPLLEEWVYSPEFGRHPSGDRLFLQLLDRDGNEGWGEGPWRIGDPDLEVALRRLCDPSVCLRSSFLNSLRKPETGYWCQPPPPSPFAPPLENLRHRLTHPLQVAAETALLDLAGRQAGLSVSAFFGGLWRDSVKSDCWMGRGTPELAAACARRAVELGFVGLKMKTTLEDPSVEKLEAIREAVGPNFEVTVDPNGRFYRLDDSWKIIRAMDAVGNLKILEDPFPRTSLA